MVNPGKYTMTPEKFNLYRLNIEHLDLAHWGLIESISEIAKGNANLYLNELSDNLVNHFMDEEEFMRSIEYPYITEHTNAHRILSVEMIRLIQLTVGGISANYVSHMTTLMYDLLIRHIDHHDQQIAAYVRQSMPK